MEFWYNLKIKNIIVLYDEEYVLNIDVEYKDRHGTISNRNYNITKLALIKHMAIAGQKYAPNRHKILKTIGMLFQFSYYLQSSALRYNKFSLPPHSLYDPTEKGQFSNIVGKAIADFLAKRIDSARFTVNYEAAMKMRGMPIRGNRPDLLAFNNNETFAIEAKGYSGNSGNMTNHKLQSQTGGIAVNFTVASVSYKLYDRIKCK